MSIPPFVDALVMILLAVTIFYSIKLNKRLTNLRANKSEFEALAMQITQAAIRAEACIAELKNAASESDQIVSGSMHKAETIRDEMNFMVERAELAVTRLDKVLGQAQKEEQHAVARGETFYEVLDEAPPAPTNPVEAMPSENIDVAASSAPYYPEAQNPSPLTSDSELGPQSKEEEELLRTLRSMR